MSYDYWKGPWILVAIPTTETDSSTSQLYQENSRSGICVTSKSNNGEFYEAVIDELYFVGPRNFDLTYNPTKPTERDITIHGRWEATRRAQRHFCERAAYLIRSSEYPRKVAICYRGVASSNGLATALERAILNLDISVGSSFTALQIVPLTSFSRLYPEFANTWYKTLCSLS
jgi:hypothetical protein